MIEKFEAKDRAITNVKKLSADEKILEITRLSGGNQESHSSINHAVELINNANKFKNSIK